jgi:formylglycine-generating enzyme required for sulfatase activity
MKQLYACLTVCLFLVQATHAQDKLSVVSIYKNNREGQRKALVLGNQNYQHQTVLKNTLRDADSMRVALEYLGFEVTMAPDKPLAETKDIIDRFVASLQPGDVAFVYFSGHGMGYLRDNYLLPIDFRAQAAEQIHNRAISTTDLRNRIVGRSVRNLFLVADACRNEADGKGNDPYRLVPPDQNPPGTLIAFATDYGLTATYRSRNNRNSLYTESLLLYLRQPLEVQEIFRQANNRTYAECKRLNLPAQYPHYIPMIYDDYYFLKRTTPTPKPEVVETESVDTVSAAINDVPTTPNTFKFLDLPFAEMVHVPGGAFEMGDKLGEGEGDEKPVHTVTVSSFYMSKYEITNRQWEAVMGSKASESECLDCPVESVTWENAQSFINKLNERTNGQFRMPTEAEWEYAAGGGSQNRTRFGNGRDVLDPREANYDAHADYKEAYSLMGSSRGKAVRVGSFRPNQLGLHDMSGNAWEWCSDVYGSYTKEKQIDPIGVKSGAYRVMRGGDWKAYPASCRTHNRQNNDGGKEDVWGNIQTFSSAYRAIQQYYSGGIRLVSLAH